MIAVAKVVQRPELTRVITSRPIADFAAPMVITRFAPYRPELHYMRGRGPKWHAKNDQRGASLHGVLGGLRTSTDVAARPSTNS
jgi:hypothetical protein